MANVSGPNFTNSGWKHLGALYNEASLVPAYYYVICICESWRPFGPVPSTWQWVLTIGLDPAAPDDQVELSIVNRLMQPSYFLRFVSN